MSYFYVKELPAKVASKGACNLEDRHSALSKLNILLIIMMFIEIHIMNETLATKTSISMWSLLCDGAYFVAGIF